ncbi:MAG: site-specific integrase [Sulfurovaceae bacterium]|nr:site-specific integrase [Sulfurovaceae bacterium]MDD5548915.1 site-specific integrase [Sulfurovaceae bacterium]
MINKDDYKNKVALNLWADDEYRKFFYNFTIEKKRYRGLIYCTPPGWAKRDRIAYAIRELDAIREKKKERIDDSISVDAAVDLHFSVLKITPFNKALKSHYERYVKKFVGNKKIVDLRPIHIKKSIQSQYEQGLKDRTVKQTLELLNPVCKMAIDNRVMVYNPCDSVKVKLPKTKKIVVNAKDRLKEILEVIVDEFKDEPYYLAFYLFAVQGRRKSEILKLRWEDMGEDYYLLRTTKNTETQKHYLPPFIANIIGKIPKFNEWIFAAKNGHWQNVEKTTNRIKKRVDGFTLHYLRNVISSAMGEDGMATTHLSGALGHANTHTIDAYLSLNYLQGSRLAWDVVETVLDVDQAKS